MKIPTSKAAETILAEAERMNPGPWIKHSRLAGECAGKIAIKSKTLDPEAAGILGMLHDIGRRFGVTDMKHVLDGYRFMNELGYQDSARICLTHSFQVQHIDSYLGGDDISTAEKQYLETELMKIEYDDYDRLIQLCDAIAYPKGVTLIETRLVDVTLRRGFNAYTVRKWKEIFKLKQYFEQKCGESIYRILGVDSLPPDISIPEENKRNKFTGETV